MLTRKTGLKQGDCMFHRHGGLKHAKAAKASLETM